jgi:hypothetical protein
MINSSPFSFYKQQMAVLQQLLLRHGRRNLVLGWGRLLIILTAVPVVYWIFPIAWGWGLGSILLLLAIFLTIVKADVANKATINQLRLQVEICEAELLALQGKFHHFPNGENFMLPQHAYASDLDVLGHNSIFQYLCRAASFNGGQVLSQWLLGGADTLQIKERQEAAAELAGNHAFRLAFQAASIASPIPQTTVQKLTEWLNEQDIFTGRAWQMSRYIFPGVMVVVMVLNWLSVLPDGVRNIALTLSAVMGFYISSKAQAVQQRLGKIVEETKALQQSLLLVENQSFNAGFLLQQQQQLCASGSAAATIGQLGKILNRMDYRFNPIVFIPLQLLLLWDVQQIHQLQQWRKLHKHQLLNWLLALGNMEAISSLATLQFNHPQWCVPQIVPGEFLLNGTQIGHPLLAENQRVANDLKIEGNGKLLLITGSNMAGKSTYLRAVGVNAVLAMAGAVVCAQHFLLSPMQIISSMRIADNLEENTSTFYAELKKLKLVIEKVNAHEPVLILLDEILRGTNSADRHAGSAALIRQLVKEKANGLIATHDLELARLTQQWPAQVHNFYFDVQVKQEELYFDYKLKEGVCSTMNASVLMKKIGIVLDAG